MRSIFVSFILLASAAAVFGQQTINPATQVRWPAVTGSGAPTASCTTANYGQPYTDTTAHAQYTCGGSTGWVLVGPTTVGSVVTAINGASGSFTFTGPGASCTSTTCTFSGGTVSVDGTAVSNPNFSSTTPTADSGYTLGTWKRDGSGNVSVELPTSGSSADAVQYNPTTTSYIVASFSGLYDDGDSNSTAIPLTSVSCTGTGPSTCTVATTSAHGLSLADHPAVDMSTVTGWNVIAPGNTVVQQVAQYGSFQITTIPDSTHFTFTTPTAITFSCTTCGSAYNATYWGIWQFAAQPYIYGHGTVYGIERNAVDVKNNFAAVTAGMAGTPTYLILQNGQNDIAAGTSVSTLYGYIQSIWASAHAAGMKVVQTTMVPAQYGTSGIGIKAGLLNQMLWGNPQSASNRSSGQYWDRYVDTATQLVLSNSLTMPNQGANVIFAHTLNDAFGVQGDNVAAFPMWVNYSPSGLGSPQVALMPPTYLGIYNASTGNQVGGIDTSGNAYFTTISATSNTQCVGCFSTVGSFLDGLQGWSSNPTYYGDVNVKVGVDSNNNNAAIYGFYAASNTSTNNYGFLRVNTGNNNSNHALRFFTSGALQFPYYTTAGLLCVDASGNLLGGTSCSSYTSGSFAGLTSGTNTSAAMVIGSGASLAPAGTGTIQATSLAGSPTSGQYWGYDGTAQGWYTPSGSGTVTTTGSPASGNMVKFSGATSITNAAYTDVVALWTSCTSGFLQYDGTCATPSGGGTVVTTGTPVSGDIAAFSGSTAITTATATQVNTLIKTLTGCTTAGYLYSPQSGTCIAGGSGSTTVGPVFSVVNGNPSSPAAPYQLVRTSGTISGCTFVTTSSDGGTALQINLKLAGTTIFTAGSATVASGTAAQTVSSFTSLSTTAITAGQLWEFDILSGTSNWTGSFECH